MGSNICFDYVLPGGVGVVVGPERHRFPNKNYIGLS